jgi:glucose dehydrogenase
MNSLRWSFYLLLSVSVAYFSSVAEPGRNTKAGWTYYGGNKGFQRYSSLNQINRDNVQDLRVVWRRAGVDATLVQKFPDISPSHYYKATPIIVDGVLYSPNAIGLLEAINPGTGKTIWVQQPFRPTLKEAAGQSMRGIDSWRHGSDLRLVLVRGSYLYAVNAKNGSLYPDFGDQGRVNLQAAGPYTKGFHWSSGPIVVRDVIVIGGSSAANGAGDGGFVKESSPDDARGYDVRTGKLLWTFHVVPKRDEPGYDTWGNNSADYAGNLSAWCPLSADEQLGLVYLPFTAPTSSYYGGWRQGDNLYSDSLVAVDVQSGKMKWYFQMIHHDLWEYDNIGPPVLGDITVDGKQIEAVMQANKNAFLYVLDRTNGKPVWPIEERPVPQSTVPGEHPSPTQPFPTKPPAFDFQGLSEDDLIDFTPELHQEALKAVRPFVLGPLYTPPTMKSDDPNGKQGTLMSPGDWGSGNWNTGAFDPETHIYYAVSMTMPEVFQIIKANDAKATMDYNEPEGREYSTIKMPGDLPYTKPPYGRITAINMDRGEQVWMVPDGDGPRNHPMLKDLNLPMLGVMSRPAPLVTKTLFFLGEGSDAIFGSGPGPYAWGKKFRAYDKATGKVMWETELPSGTTGGPMTYMYQGKQYIVVAVGSKKDAPELVALALSPGQNQSSMPAQPTTAVRQRESETVYDGVYTAAQAKSGEGVYHAKCALCHGDNLTGGANESPALKGDQFISHWQGKPVRALYSRIITTMPLTDPGSLNEKDVLELVAYILKGNGYPVGKRAAQSANDLNAIAFVGKRSSDRQ